MKKKNLKFKKYLKSKKGFSLFELICAIMIMAIAVSATATGLNISNQSITKNSLMDKASAKAQMYCDVIMTYVEKTPSNDPNHVENDGWDSLTDTKKNANKLFKTSSDQTYTFTDDIQNNIDTDVKALDSNFSAKQCTSADIDNRPFNKNEVAYTIQKEGSYTNSRGISMVSYKVTVYIDYGTNGTTSCTGIITKSKYVQ